MVFFVILSIYYGDFILSSKQLKAQKERYTQYNSRKQYYIEIIKYTSKCINHRIQFNFHSQISLLAQYIIQYILYTL